MDANYGTRQDEDAQSTAGRQRTTIVQYASEDADKSVEADSASGSSSTSTSGFSSDTTTTTANSITSQAQTLRRKTPTSQ